MIYVIAETYLTALDYMMDMEIPYESWDYVHAPSVLKETDFKCCMGCNFGVGNSMVCCGCGCSEKVGNEDYVWLLDCKHPRIIELLEAVSHEANLVYK